MKEEAGLGVWLHLIRKRFLFLALASFIAGVATLILVLLLPRWYRATASILPPRETGQQARPDFSGLQNALQLDLLPAFSSEVTLLDVYLGILDSQSVGRALVGRFDLQEYYGKPNLVKTLRELRARTRVTSTRNGIIEISVEDKSPQMSADLANAFLEELDVVYRSTRSSASKRQREFLEDRVQEVKVAIDSLEVEFVRFQTREGFTVLSRGMTEAALAAGELLGQRMALSLQLEMLTRMGVVSSRQRSALEIELAAVEKQIAVLPVLGMDTARKLRNLRIQEIVFERLQEQLESARIEEARDTPAVEILDRAIPPDRHSRPRRGLVTLAGGLIGFVLAFVWVVRSEERNAA